MLKFINVKNNELVFRSGYDDMRPLPTVGSRIHLLDTDNKTVWLCTVDRVEFFYKRWDDNRSDQMRVIVYVNGVVKGSCESTDYWFGM